MWEGGGGGYMWSVCKGGGGGYMWSMCVSWRFLFITSLHQVRCLGCVCGCGVCVLMCIWGEHICEGD